MSYTLKKLKEMIPLYVSKRLSESEKKDFEKALGQYPELTRELMEADEIKKSYQDIKEEAPSPSNALYDRILKNIKEENVKQPLFAKPGFMEQVLEFLKIVFSSPKISWSVAAAQLVIIIVFFIAFPAEKSFETLSENHIASKDSGMINVVFKEDAKEKDMRKLIESVNGSMVNGPTSDGLYIIKTKKIDKIEVVLNELNNSSIVRLAVKKY
jgi:hypothetical protein